MAANICENTRFPCELGSDYGKFCSWLQHFFQHLPQPEAAKCNMNITDKLVPSLKMNTSSQYAASSLEKTDSCWYLGIPSLKNALPKKYFRILQIIIKGIYGRKEYSIVSVLVYSLANPSQFLCCLSRFLFPWYHTTKTDPLHVDGNLTLKDPQKRTCTVLAASVKRNDAMNSAISSTNKTNTNTTTMYRSNHLESSI